MVYSLIVRNTVQPHFFSNWLKNSYLVKGIVKTLLHAHEMTINFSEQIENEYESIQAQKVLNVASSLCKYDVSFKVKCILQLINKEGPSEETFSTTFMK